MAAVNLRALGKSYGHVHVIHDVDLEIGDGELADDGVPPGAVRVAEYLGGLTIVHVSRGAEELLVVQLAGEFSVRAGQAIRFNLVASGVHLFAAAGDRLVGGPP